MKIKDLRVGTHLKLVLGVIAVSIILLTTLSWIQTDKMWQETRGLYDHPLMVRRALGELEVDIVTMHKGMKNLFFAKDEEEIAAAINDIDINKANAFRQFDTLYKSYLGPRTDVDKVYDEFATWNSMREETIRLLREGKRAEALARTKSKGIVSLHVRMVMGDIKKMDDFARERADRFYRDAENQKSFLNRQLILVAAGCLLLTLIIISLLLKAIRDPLKELSLATEGLQQGNMDSRSGYVSANEFGVLSTMFNTMAETIETQMVINRRAADLAGAMLRETGARDFCREVLEMFLEQTGSQIGAVYLLNEAKTDFEHFESIGLGSGGRASFSAKEREGEFGAALATGRMQRIIVPESTRFTFPAVSGELTPSEIITIPLQVARETVAVISLGTIHSYNTVAIQLLDQVQATLAAGMNGVLAFQKIQNFAERLEEQNRELEAQKRELEAQGAELVEQNTELQMQKRQLDKANELKNAFLSNMSHELRTPLNAVIALSGVLSHRLQNTIPDEEYSYLEVIERNGQDLLELINDLLDLSRIEAGREEIALNRFTVSELIDQIVANIDLQARKKNITLANQIDGGLPPMTSDFEKCRHILQNILVNAVKFTEEGSVTISARHTDNEIHIFVKDTGIGIPPDKIQYIFDEFRQADERTSKRYGGTGLGLAIAKKYANMVQGTIDVESEPGKGSTFVVRLPLDISRPTDRAAERIQLPEYTPSADSSGCSGKTILLVEDSEPAIIQITDILSAEGYCILTARNGQDALEQIGRTIPDAVILDLMMPEVDGFEVLHAIRRQEETRRLPVIILTAKHVTREELALLVENNIHQLIQKGDINKRDLLGAVSKMVSNRQEKKPPARRPSTSNTPGRITVLVIEDNPDNMMAVKALLQDRYTIIEATEGRSGIAQAKMHKPDIILLDIALPDMDGFTVADHIRNEDDIRDIPIIAVTADAMKGSREEILNRGFNGYVSKPVDKETLISAIEEVFDGA